MLCINSWKKLQTNDVVNHFPHRYHGEPEQCFVEMSLRMKHSESDFVIQAEAEPKVQTGISKAVVLNARQVYPNQHDTEFWILLVGEGWD